MAEHIGSTGSLTAHQDWLGSKEAIRISSHAVTGFPDFYFAFHDKEEIGPRMLARIAKRTELKPEDL